MLVRRMKHAPHQPQVVVYVSDRSYQQGGTIRPDICAGNGPAKCPDTRHVGDDLMAAHLAHAVPMARRYDPAAVHRGFPDRWRAYVRANYRGVRHICQTFDVSERTARKWLEGETGAVGGHVAVAVQEHPEAAPRMLFAAE